MAPKLGIEEGYLGLYDAQMPGENISNDLKSPGHLDFVPIVSKIIEQWALNPPKISRSLIVQ